MRKVKYAKLHVNLFIAGIGDLGTVLPCAAKRYNEEMFYGVNDEGSEGLHVLVKGVEVTIPPASTAYVVYAPEKPSSK